MLKSGSRVADDGGSLSAAQPIPLAAKTTPEPPPSFALFGKAILEGRTEQAAVMLVAMLELDTATAVFATDFFYQQYQTDPDVLAIAQGIRQDIRGQRSNDALVKIHRCFGLQGLQALQMLTNLSKWLAD